MEVEHGFETRILDFYGRNRKRDSLGSMLYCDAERHRFSFLALQHVAVEAVDRSLPCRPFQKGLAATHFSFTHAGTMSSH